MARKQTEKERRDKIADEIMVSVPWERIVAAAARVMAQKRGGEHFTKEEIADWIKHLDADGLLLLREIAEELERKTVQ